MLYRASISNSPAPDMLCQSRIVWTTYACVFTHRKSPCVEALNALQSKQTHIHQLEMCALETRVARRAVCDLQKLGTKVEDSRCYDVISLGRGGLQSLLVG
jgi:hypothetical protein